MLTVRSRAQTRGASRTPPSRASSSIPTRRPEGLLLAAALALAAGVALAAPASAQQVLPLIALEEEGRASGWWVEDAAPPPALRVLIDAASARGVALLDPERLKERPRVTRVYKVARLTPANAANLANLYGASHVLLGGLRHERLPPLEAAGLRRHRVVADLHLLAVRSPQPTLRLTLAREGHGATDDEARQQALDTLAADLAAELSTLWRGVAGEVGLKRDEPWIVLAGATRQAQVDATLRALRAQPEVTDVTIAWLAGGLVALDVNPASAQEPAVIERLAEALTKNPVDGTTLSVTSRGDGAIYLTVGASSRGAADGPP